MKRQYIKKERWIEVIDGTKTAHEITVELGCTFGSVYQAANKYGLSLIDGRKNRYNTMKAYYGVSVEELRNELESYTLQEVYAKHKFTVDLQAFRNWLNNKEIPYMTRNQKAHVKCKPIKRTGIAMDMIRTLLPYYTDASIGRVFGYSRERIRQIREQVELNATKQEVSHAVSN